MTKPKAKDPTAPEGANVGSWRGYVRYECSLCAFDTLSPDAFADHFRNLHGSLESHAEPAPVFEEAPPVAGESLVED